MISDRAQNRRIFVSASDGPYLNERSTLEDHVYDASRLPKRPKTNVLQSTDVTVGFLNSSYT